MKTTHQVLLGMVAAAGMFVWGRSSASKPVESEREIPKEEDEEPTLFLCPMHPQVVLPDFVPCPICGMDLVPREEGGEEDPRRLAMSPAARELARIETEVVSAKNVTRPVRMVGKVAYDETAVSTISARVAGRLDRLFVDYTGVPVSHGDHLVWLYSPELLTAQEELLSARERLPQGNESASFLEESDRRFYQAAREKLLLYGLTEEQVLEIEERGTAEDHVMLTSPSSGVVIEKRLDQGAYVQTGTPIYSVADLSRLWVLLDAYEQDLPWLRHGQDVMLEVEALPGRTLEGVISFVDPYIDERTRTAKVRVNIDNSSGRLKPGMFVRAVAESRLGAGGVVIDQSLAGKWVSPMHPEIVKDEPGACDVCGMDLVPAEDLGLVEEAPTEQPLIVPSSAVLRTGERAVVYVEVPDAERPTYEGREVILGPRAGEVYLVMEGLSEGERVVVQGAFCIDSAMQIQAKPSMMSQGGADGVGEGPEVQLFRRSLEPLIAQYLVAQELLAADDPAASRVALLALEEHLELSDSALDSSARRLWQEERARIRTSLEAISEAEDLDSLRVPFSPLSDAVRNLVSQFGHVTDAPLYEVVCPMAFGSEEAYWLQLGDLVNNPYHGDSMLRCGSVVRTLEAQ